MYNRKMGRIYLRKGVWYIDACYKGKRIRRAVGTDRKLALAVLKKTEVQLIENKHLDIKKNEKVRFSDFSKYFLDTYSKINKRSWKRDQISIVRLNRFFGSKFLYEITNKDIEEYKKKRLETGIQTSTLNRELACLRTILYKAVEWGNLSINPPKIKLFKENNLRIRYLTQAEERKLLEITPEPLKGIILMAINTGMRRNEILNLKWSDVDLSAGIIIVKDSKSKEKREIPINEVVRKVILNHFGNGAEYIFTNKYNQNYSGSYITHWFNKLLKKAGIKDFHFHDLRHTFASRLAMKTGHLQAIKELLGHKDYRMTLRYSHLTPEFKRDLVKMLEDDSVIDGLNFGTNMAQAENSKFVKIAKSLVKQ